MEGLIYLPCVGSTNQYLKERRADCADLTAVYTTDQTAGRGRLGRSWANARGQALYFSLIVRRPLAAPATLPLACSLWVRQAVQQCFGASCLVKWPNDLLLNGKKLVGILCEGAPVDGQAAYVCGIGVNLFQTQAAFDAAGLPYATSLALEGVPVPHTDAAARLAQAIRQNFCAGLPVFSAGGFAPFLDEYRAVCANLARPVQFEGGRGVAVDVDAEGRLVVQQADGQTRVFTGEVSVQGIYGQL